MHNWKKGVVIAVTVTVAVSWYGLASQEKGKERKAVGRIEVVRDEKAKDIVVIFHLKKAGRVVFSHKWHVIERKVPCDICHKSLHGKYQEKAKKLDKKLTDVIDKEYCARCHSGKLAFDVSSEKSCGRCHGGEKK